ncbi:MAG: universal stress protein [Saprospirales bacterium]|nr:universal stress protein [Saprospirales bacterium]
MKNILVPTDFSACARYAESAAIQLAKRFGATVFFVHFLQSDAYPANSPEWHQKRANKLILLEDIQRKYPDVAIKVDCLPGPLLDQVAHWVSAKGIDLIVMGSYGVSGKSEYFIGSNTQRVVRQIHCPVLVIKDPIEKLAFNKVVFASGFNEREQEPFLRFKKWVVHFTPEIHLVAIHTASLFEAPYIVTKSAMDEFQALCEPLHAEIHVFPDLNIEAGIRVFAQSIHADLIGISNHERHPLKRILVGSNVEALINHSKLPVLVIDYET